MTIQRYGLQQIKHPVQSYGIICPDEAGDYITFADYAEAIRNCQESCIAAGYDQGRKDAEVIHPTRLAVAVRAMLDEHFLQSGRGAAWWNHSHRVPGIWDPDNSPGLRGTCCKLCAIMAEVVAALAGEMKS